MLYYIWLVLCLVSLYTQYSRATFVHMGRPAMDFPGPPTRLFAQADYLSPYDSPGLLFYLLPTLMKYFHYIDDAMLTTEDFSPLQHYLEGLCPHL